MPENIPEAAPVPLRCVVVDDDTAGRVILEHFIELSGGVLVHEASLSSGVLALDYFRRGGPADVLFLDVQMPDLTGLELLRLLPQPRPAVVLVTQSPDFAVDAFELSVTDYLVKPYSYARFSLAVERLRHRLAPPPGSPAPPVAPGDDAPALFMRVNNRMVRINFAEVLYIEALSNHVVIVLDKQKHIVYTTLKALVERLPAAHFLRVHRSYVINTRHMLAVEDNGAVMTGGHTVPVGRAYQEEFYRHINRY